MQFLGLRGLRPPAEHYQSERLWPNHGAPLESWIGMRITIVNRYYWPDESATSRMTTSLATALAARGFRVRVVSSRHLHNDTSVVLPAQEKHEGVHIRRVWSTGLGRSRLSSRALDYASFHLGACMRLLREGTADDICISCSDPPLISVTTMLPVLLRGSRQVNWLFDLFPEVALDLQVIGRRSPMGRLLLALRDWSLRRSALNVAPMQAMSDHLADRGIDRASMSVIENWSDGNAIFPLPADTSVLREEWGLSGKFVVGYSGNLGRAHEFGTLVDAAERLKERTDIVFLFVGGGYRKAWVEAETRRRNLTNVIFKPLQPRERLNDTLAVADVHIVSQLPEMEPFVIPSKFYGIAAAGRPTIFIGSGGSEIARHIATSNCGEAVHIGDVDALMGAILRVADWDFLGETMGANARRMFDAQFTEERGVDQWLGELTRLRPPRRTADAQTSPRRVASP